jgi:class 3 adenylate cyclase
MNGSASDVITLLLTDVVGSAMLWERHPGDMAAALARHNEIVAEVVASCRGSLIQERGEGDSTFSVFPLASDAVAAAARMAQAFAAEEWPEAARLSVRIALNTGEVEDRGGSYTGLTATRGARLRALAFGGQVLLGASTAAVVADSLPPGTWLVNLGPKPLKDLSRPENTFELRIGPDPGDRQTWPWPADDAACSAQSWAEFSSPEPLLGREEELSALEGAWTQASGGTRVLAMLSGEAGIGKTTLAAEFARCAHSAGALVLYGRWDEEPLAPYQAFLQALGEYGRTCPRSILRADLREHGGEISRLFPDVIDRIGVDDAPLGGGPEAERFRLFESLDAWIAAMASRRPVLLVLDDLHWADRPALLLIQHLLRAPRSTRLMLLATLRDTDLDHSELAGRLPALTRNTTTHRVAIHGLGDVEVVQLLRQAAGRELEVREIDLASELRRDTAGNPFFLREIIRQLLEVGALEPGGNGSVTSRFEVPAAVRDVVSWHVAQLSEPCASALYVAAVIGQEFDTRVLGAATEINDDRLLDLLDEAGRAGLIGDVPESATTSAFAHAVVRRVLLDGLSRARRTHIHRRVGEALEQDARSRSSLAELAHHYCASAALGQQHKALRYARLAGEAALEAVAYESAVGHFLQALDVVERYGPDDALSRCELLLALGSAHDKAGEYPARDARFVAAADAARAVGRTDLFIRATIGYGGVAVLPAGVQPDRQAHALLEEALERVSDDRISRARLLARLAHWSHYSRPHAERRALWEEALAIARELEDPRIIAEVLLHGCWALDGPGDVPEQLAIAVEVLRLGDVLDDHELALQGLRIRLAAVLEAGDFLAALDTGRSLRRLAEEFRHPEYLRLATMWEILLAALEGRFDAAEHLSTDLHVRLQHAGHPQADLIYGAQTLSWRWLQGSASEYLLLLDDMAAKQPLAFLYQALAAWFHAEAGSKDKTAEILRAVSVDAIVSMDPDFTWWASVVGFVNAAAAIQDTAWVTALYELVLPFADRNCTLGLTAFIGAAAHHLGVLAAALGRWDDAAAHLEAALARHVEMGASPFAALTQQALADVLRSRDGTRDRERADQLQAAALTTAEQLGLGAVSARMRAPRPMGRLSSQGASGSSDRRHGARPGPPVRPGGRT